ncbi:MAG TPA: serine hydrolase [Propionicimonas sp.]|nr:serine hydrolase [Propionicimonas sp.]HRA06394.1 serine hydrolase [Propionicimonas sp.]
MNHLSRRSLLLSATALAGGALLAACSGTPTIPRPTASPTGPIKDQLDEVLKVVSSGSEKFGVYLQDVRSGGTYSFNGDYASQNASMVKVMIALMVQRKARTDGGTLSQENVELTTKMITQSDNDAAEKLWAYGGGPDAYQQLADELKMTHTRRETGRDDWSWTWTSPSDQVVLLNHLVDGGTDAFTPAEATFVYDLMGKVQDDQTWGVGAPKSSAVAVHLKNGWVQFKSSDGLWAVNSMGTVAGAGRDYRMAVMTRVPDFATGRELTSEVGRQVFSILGSGTL